MATQYYSDTKELGRNQEQPLFALEWMELESSKSFCSGRAETSCYSLKQAGGTPSEVRESQITGDTYEIYSTLFYA